MLKQASVFAIFVILLLSAGCKEKLPANLSDCENIKNEQKRDNCFVNLIEISAMNDTSKSIEACRMITDTELMDLCLFKVSQDSWRTMPADTLRDLCSNISSEPLRNSCNDIQGRPHLQVIR